MQINKYFQQRQPKEKKNWTIHLNINIVELVDVCHTAISNIQILNMYLLRILNEKKKKITVVESVRLGLQ